MDALAPVMDVGMSRTDAAVARLSELVQQCDVGERLGTKQELQHQCGVSKGTFNEAVRILQAQGVLVMRPGPGGGLFVADPTPMAKLGHSLLALDANATSVAEAVRIRDALDPLLVEDALEHCSKAALAGLRQQIRCMSQSIEEGDPVGFVRANWALHARIARISPNELLRSIYMSLLDLVEAHTVSVQPSREQPLDEYIRHRFRLHDDLVEAIGRGDGAEARRLIKEHAMTSEEEALVA